jgi:hypothetical protein
MIKPGDSNGPKLSFESYKLIAEDLSRTREQRDTIVRSYITINSVILAALAVLLRNTQLAISWEALIIVPLLVAGIVASLQWIWLIPEYKILVAVRVGALKEMEKNPVEVSCISALFNDEDEQLNEYRQLTLLKRVSRYISWASILPGTFIALYLIALVIVGVVVVPKVLG